MSYNTHTAHKSEQWISLERRVTPIRFDDSPERYFMYNATVYNASYKYIHE